MHCEDIDIEHSTCKPKDAVKRQPCALKMALRLAEMTERGVGEDRTDKIHVVAWLPLPENDLVLRDNLQVHADYDVCQVFQHNVLKARNPLHQCDRLHLERGHIMASQAAQLTRDGLCHATLILSSLTSSLRKVEEAEVDEMGSFAGSKSHQRWLLWHLFSISARPASAHTV